MRKYRPKNLKNSLIRRIVAVALVCFGLVISFVVINARIEMKQSDVETAQLVTRQLEMQLLRINVALDVPYRFPEWSAIVVPTSTSGRCIGFENRDGVRVRTNCTGSGLNLQTTPQWFTSLYRFVFPPQQPARQALSYGGVDYGTISVLSDGRGNIAQTWQVLKQMLGLTLITVVSLCLMTYFAIERALSPTKDVIAGLNRIAGGDFAFRLPRFQLSELQRIGEVSNELASTIETSMADRTRLAKKLINAQEQERRHLARELHDEFAQNLTAINALAASIEQSASESEELGAEARTLSQISMRMMSSLRQTVVHLRPADLEQFGLIESLAQLVAVWTASSRSKRFRFIAPKCIAPLPHETEAHLFRIAQEGLTNAAKHSDAKSVELSVAWEPHAGTIRMVIEDDGTGRRQAGRVETGCGMGLVNMQERVAALGGALAFKEPANGGLRVEVVIPVGMAEAS